MKTVLLVDDEENLRFALSNWLAGQGLSVLTAASGEEALEIVRGDPAVAVAVLDVNMPGLNGIETLAALKALRPELESIIVTGYPTVEYALEGRRLGASEYLSKPCDIHLLLEVVRKALSRAAKNPRWSGGQNEASGPVEAK
uniref:Response regulator with CheY-like receiver, AAA-type ATPase, and DNA-binding domains n=1 Tax=Desulfovibrio sp. U5L TaxID=596152 RepID=I2Q0Y1_9BACT